MVILDYFCFLAEYCFFFKQKTAYEMRISDWSSDVCSSDLHIADENGVRTGRSDDVLLREPLCRAFRALYASGGGNAGRIGNRGRLGDILGACHATQSSACI